MSTGIDRGKLAGRQTSFIDAWGRKCPLDEFLIPLMIMGTPQGGCLRPGLGRLSFSSR